MQAKRYFRQYEVLDYNAGDVLYTVGWFIAICFWAFGTFWLVVAVITIIRIRRFPFTIGWWGTVFPMGVYSNGTVLISKELPSKFFKNLGTVSANVLCRLLSLKPIEANLNLDILSRSHCIMDRRLHWNAQRSCHGKVILCSLLE